MFFPWRGYLKWTNVGKKLLDEAIFTRFGVYSTFFSPNRVAKKYMFEIAQRERERMSRFYNFSFISTNILNRGLFVSNLEMTTRFDSFWWHCPSLSVVGPFACERENTSMNIRILQHMKRYPYAEIYSSISAWMCVLFPHTQVDLQRLLSPTRKKKILFHNIFTRKKKRGGETWTLFK